MSAGMLGNGFAGNAQMQLDNLRRQYEQLVNQAIPQTLGVMGKWQANPAAATA